MRNQMQKLQPVIMRSLNENISVSNQVVLKYPLYSHHKRRQLINQDF